ncbi:MAG TPA: aldehyde dehydrogenase family protein [Thermoanaerobaculia bacterium]|jgi:acyl-CoA reductase-like NAD-dependent aldehyde dehydrogenase|nr:aldehyde dehydrogenase family protein [Thermoanaerobaculia bacterium]
MTAIAIDNVRSQLFINGEFVDARSGETFATINPATEEKIADVASAGIDDVDAAVKAARAQMEPGSEWQKMKPRDRAKVMWRLADILTARAEEIGRIETIDNGKPIFESQYVDTPAAAECLYYFAGWSGKVTGDTIPVADNAFTYTLREPVGVVGAITPWNFPLMLAVWKIAPALACGNTVVIKPASNTSLSLLKFAEYAKEAGLPAGVLNVVPGRGSVVGNAIVDHPGVDAITFTGSTEVGRGLMARAAKTLKKVALELGGKSPNIVFADADLDAAAKGALNAIFYGKGEVCAAGSRLLVEEGAHEELMAKVIERANKMTAGDPLHPKTRLGAIVSKEQMETVLSYIEAGKSEGAKLVAGGERADIGTGKGYFVQPTIFDDVQVEHRISREEIFGPVLATIKFKDAEDAVAKGNATVYGLAAAVWTRDISKAHRMAKAIKAGTVWVNTYNLYDPALPFGGFKESGFGRDQGKDALEKYTQTKSVWVNL